MYCPFVLDTDWDGVVRQCTQSERTSLPLSRHGKGGDDSNLHPAPADVMMWDSHGCSHHSSHSHPHTLPAPLSAWKYFLFVFVHLLLPSHFQNKNSISISIIQFIAGLIKYYGSYICGIFDE